MSLNEILAEVIKLSPTERDQVISKLVEVRDGNAARTTQDRVLRQMLDKGLIRRIPLRRSSPRRSRPMSIQGDPLSQTIIEERR